jgi:hypothetical protein
VLAEFGFPEFDEVGDVRRDGYAQATGARYFLSVSTHPKTAHHQETPLAKRPERGEYLMGNREEFCW